MGSEDLIFVCISDTHCKHEDLGELPKGDVLLVSGDFTQEGRPSELRAFADWLRKQPFRHKVLVAGGWAEAFA